MSANALDPAAKELLRHTLAIVAYRGGKTLRDAPADFASFRAGPTSRSAVEILAHIGDLFAWAEGLSRGDSAWDPIAAGSWQQGVERFFAELQRLDATLQTIALDRVTAERLLQGPLADALTHIGQIALLRRLAGSPVRGENYVRAEIVAGRLGPEQAPPRREFD